jgi:hypothetical protein
MWTGRPKLSFIPGLLQLDLIKRHLQHDLEMFYPISKNDSSFSFDPPY